MTARRWLSELKHGPETWNGGGAKRPLPRSIILDEKRKKSKLVGHAPALVVGVEQVLGPLAQRLAQELLIQGLDLGILVGVANGSLPV